LTDTTIHRVRNLSFLKGAYHVIDDITVDSCLECRFANPLLSVAGQRLVLNLKGFQTRTYETRDLSREVDRQLEGFAEPDCSIALDDIGESGQEASESGNPSRN